MRDRVKEIFPDDVGEAREEKKCWEDLEKRIEEKKAELDSADGKDKPKVSRLLKRLTDLDKSMKDKKQNKKGGLNRRMLEHALFDPDSGLPEPPKAQATGMFLHCLVTSPCKSTHLPYCTNCVPSSTFYHQ